MCSVLVSTHGFMNELCYMWVALCHMCGVLVLTYGTTRLPEIPSESMCFQCIRWTPSDDFQSSSQSILYTSGFIL